VDSLRKFFFDYIYYFSLIPSNLRYNYIIRKVG